MFARRAQKGFMVSAFMVAGVLCAAGNASFAESAGAGSEELEERARETEQQLETIETQIEGSRARERTLTREMSALRSEAKVLSERLIALAAIIQSREGAITAAEQRLIRLDAEARRIQSSLSARRDMLANTLAGLQRLERNPPPALVVKPGDALAALRGAVLLGTVAPALKEEADSLASELVSLRDVRRRMLQEGEMLETNITRLEAERGEIEDLLQRKEQLVALTEEELVAERARTAELAEQVESLKELMAEIERRRDLADEAARREEQRRLDADAEPSVAFTSLRHSLPFPAQGVLVRGYGDDNGFGSRMQGVSIATRENAQVTAPADGRIDFAGNFRSYGQLLILDVGEEYHILLAGLQNITVEPGQFVRAGEPVGSMGTEPARATLIGDRLSDPSPLLYIEFRKGGNTVDPASWWIGPGKEVRG